MVYQLKKRLCVLCDLQHLSLSTKHENAVKIKNVFTEILQFDTIFQIFELDWISNCLLNSHYLFQRSEISSRVIHVHVYGKNQQNSYLNRRRIIHSHHTVAVDTSLSLYHRRSMVVQLSHLMVVDPTVTTAVPSGVHAAVLIPIVVHKLIFTYRVQHKVSCDLPLSLKI